MSSPGRHRLRVLGVPLTTSARSGSDRVCVLVSTVLGNGVCCNLGAVLARVCAADQDAAAARIRNLLGHLRPRCLVNVCAPSSAVIDRKWRQFYLEKITQGPPNVERVSLSPACKGTRARTQSRCM